MNNKEYIACNKHIKKTEETHEDKYRVKNRWVAIYIKGIFVLPDNSNVVNKECVTRKDAIEQRKKWHKTVSSVDFCYPQIYDKESNKYEMMSEYFW